jgi:hypothetical protein
LFNTGVGVGVGVGVEIGTGAVGGESDPDNTKLLKIACVLELQLSLGHAG